MEEPIPPKYVRLGHTAMVYRPESNVHDEDYYRPAGHWSIDFTYRDGKFYADAADRWIVKSLHNVELIPITREEFLEDNKGYVSDKEYLDT